MGGDLFNNLTYIPTLAVRPSEIEALRRLPDYDKDAMLPAIRLRKWHNSGTLEKSFEAIEGAFNGRRMVLDLGAPPVEIKNDCDARLVALHAPGDGHSEWVQLVRERPQCVPVLQWGGDAQQTARQANALLGLDRGLAIRLRRAHQWDIGTLGGLAGLTSFGGANLLVILDYGQLTPRTDLTSAAAELAGVASAAKALAAGANVTATVAASSFPSEFASIDRQHARLPIRERGLFSLFSGASPLQAQGVATVYGDYGSVCCDRGEMARGGAPRIDLACRNEWAYYRREEDQSYIRAAQAIMADTGWRPDINIWATNEIRRAANGDLEDLHYPRRWVTVRINLHLHQQANYHSPGGVTDTDEPWND